jgi:hypothetical protein
VADRGGPWPTCQATLAHRPGQTCPQALVAGGQLRRRLRPAGGRGRGPGEPPAYPELAGEVGLAGGGAGGEQSTAAASGTCRESASGGGDPGRGGSIPSMGSLSAGRPSCWCPPLRAGRCGTARAHGGRSSGAGRKGTEGGESLRARGRGDRGEAPAAGGLIPSSGRRAVAGITSSDRRRRLRQAAASSWRRKTMELGSWAGP